jgi:hypothetical protein
MAARTPSDSFSALAPGNRYGRSTVQHAAQCIVVRAQLQPRDVAQVRGLAVRAVLDHDVLELLLGLQPSLRIDDVLEFRSRERRLTADLAGGDLDVLFAHGVQDFFDVHVARRDLGWIEPQPHRIVARSEHPDVAHARQTRQHVSDLNDRVIAQVQRVVAAVRGLQENDHGEVRRAFLGDESQLTHHLRQPRLGLGDAVLGLYLRDVEIGSELESHRDGKDAVRRGRGIGIDRIFHAVDLLLQGRDDRFRDGLRRSPGILAAHDHGGRHDFRILADGQRRYGQQPRHRDQDREHRRKDRALDEERGDVHRLRRHPFEFSAGLP